MTGIGFQHSESRAAFCAGSVKSVPQTGGPSAIGGSASDPGRAALRMGRQRMRMLALVACLAALPGCKAEPCGSEEMAGVMAQDVVQRQLQDPTSTEFLEMTVARESEDPCAYVVTGSYSGRNSLGETILNEFVVVIQKTRGEDEWEAVNLSIF